MGKTQNGGIMVCNMFQGQQEEQQQQQQQYHQPQPHPSLPLYYHPHHPPRHTPSMSHLPSTDTGTGTGTGTDTYDLYFTGKDDPRGCVVIGEDTKPVYLVFETCDIPTTRTTVYRNHEEIVALFDWIPGNHFGRAVIGSKQIPMSNLVMPGSTQNARMFFSEGTTFEWRRRYEDLNSYDLFAFPNKRIARFRRYAQATPVGPSHGMLQYTFSHDLLLLEALLALCLNRWIDWRGM